MCCLVTLFDTRRHVAAVSEFKKIDVRSFVYLLAPVSKASYTTAQNRMSRVDRG